ncbi:UNVERIFIED_CONTAM: hypothetical protein GTU68_064229 [Idotea baltica]|nr:hypothetical protein [Idotea baltica]
MKSFRTVTDAALPSL